MRIANRNFERQVRRDRALLHDGQAGEEDVSGDEDVYGVTRDEDWPHVGEVVAHKVRKSHKEPNSLFRFIYNLWF